MILEAKYNDNFIRVGDEVVESYQKAVLKNDIYYVTKIKLNKKDQVSNIYAINKAGDTVKDITIMDFTPTGFMNKDILNFAEKMAGIDY